MKKIILKLSSILTIFIFVFSSCAKDRTCVCTDEDGDKTEVEYKKVTKKWMKNSAACVSYKYIAAGDSFEVECEIE